MGITFFTLGIFALGFLSGFGGVFSFLAYTGKEPVNVLLFFTLFVFTQLLFSLGSLIPLISKARLSHALTPFGALLKNGLMGTLKRLEMAMGAEKRALLKGTTGQIAHELHTFKTTLFALVFSRMQLVGTAFASGALLAFLTRILFFDTGFGWQTTLRGETAPEILHGLCRILALPWSWALENGVPTLEAIEGSRLIIQKGMGSLADTHLAAWWPFLAMALLVYGLLPRLILFAVAKTTLSKALTRELLETPEIKILCGTLSAPKIHTHRAEKPAPKAEEELDRRKAAKPEEKESPNDLPPKPHVLVPLEMSELSQGVMPWVTKRFSGATVESISFDDPKPCPTEASHVFLLMEAWQPPIREFLEWVAAYRKALPMETPLTLLLTGEMGDEPSVAEPHDLDVWRKVVAAQAIAGLRVDALSLKREELI